MDQETKDKLKAAGLEGVITAFETLETGKKKSDADLATAQVDLKKATETITEKDKVINQKNADIIGARKEYKKLSEMTDIEKAQMSEKEIELQKRQEEHEEDVAKFKQEQQDTLQKEITARRGREFAKLAGTDKELLGKLETSYKKIVDSDKAQTEEEIAVVALSAFNMLGVPKPPAINVGGGGNAGSEVKPGEFADTEAGKSLSQAMGLPVETPKA